MAQDILWFANKDFIAAPYMQFNLNQGLGLLKCNFLEEGAEHNTWTNEQETTSERWRDKIQWNEQETNTNHWINYLRIKLGGKEEIDKNER